MAPWSVWKSRPRLDLNHVGWGFNLYPLVGPWNHGLAVLCGTFFFFFFCGGCGKDREEGMRFLGTALGKLKVMVRVSPGKHGQVRGGPLSLVSAGLTINNEWVLTDEDRETGLRCLLY